MVILCCGLTVGIFFLALDLPLDALEARTKPDELLSAYFGRARRGLGASDPVG